MLNSALTNLIVEGFWESLYMTLVSTVLSYAAGLPLGIALVVMDRNGIRPIPWLAGVIGIVINVLRSVPFLILAITVIPVTRAIMGTALGPTAAIVPLVIGAAPFVARLVESSLKEIDRGIIEAARSMGASTFQLIWKVLLPEAKPSLIVGSAIAVTTILGYSAMCGFLGAGGLGDIAVRYGYHRYQYNIMMITVALLVIIVQILQETGMRASRRSDRRL